MQLQTLVTILCVISGVAGLSVMTASSWAIYAKDSEFLDLYPDISINALKNLSLPSHKLLNNFSKDWKDVKDICLISLCLGCGLLQFLVAVFVLYGWEESNHTSLSTRFIIANTLIMVAIIGSILGTTCIKNLAIGKLPLDLRRALGLDEWLILAFLQFGLNSFTVWMAFDVVFLFVSGLIVASVVVKGVVV